MLGDELTAWLYLLTGGYGSEEEMRAMEEKFPTMEEFARQYGFATGDPKLVQAYQDYGDMMSEEKTFKRLIREKATEEGLQQGLRQGLQQGRTEGRAEERAEIIAKLRSLGIEEHLISQLG